MGRWQRLTGIPPDLDLLQHWHRLRGVSRETSVGNEALLRRHGLQVTAQRLAVLRAVSDRSHSTADDIYSVVRAEIGAISRQAVYDALGALTDKGLLRRIQPARSPVSKGSAISAASRRPPRSRSSRRLVRSSRR